MLDEKGLDGSFKLNEVTEGIKADEKHSDLMRAVAESVHEIF